MLAEARAMVVTQPAFTHAYGDKYLALTPSDIHPHLYPLEAPPTAGHPPSPPAPTPPSPTPDPLRSIQSAASRLTTQDTPFNPDQALSPHEALRMETIGGAYASFQEKHKGSIKPGKLADLALLSTDPTNESAEVMMTLVGGQIVWER